MTQLDAITAQLLDFLATTDGADGPLDVDTDLLATGRLDSMLVMDLVCFLASRFQVQMQPRDISPANLRNVKSLADYVRRRNVPGAEAA